MLQKKNFLWKPKNASKQIIGMEIQIEIVSNINQSHCNVR
jgi:hypothetical protein